MPIITMLSDFGSRDPYVAEMKATIISICPHATIVDISHEVDPFDIRMGAFILAAAAPYFPHGTIHVAVVDPGVGGRRKPIVIETSRAIYVGPDNGVLTLAAKNDGISNVYHITNRRFMRREISATFHGRDIFAYAAALIACGAKPQEAGDELKDYVVPSFSEPKLSEGKVLCEVLHVDNFGNVITNVPAAALAQAGISIGEKLRVMHGKKSIEMRFLRTYSDARRQEPLALIGSHNFLEIGVNLGDAGRMLGVAPGSKLTIHAMKPYRP